MRLLLFVLAVLLAAPTGAQSRQQPRQPAAPTPAESIWGKSSFDLVEAFDRDMARQRRTSRLGFIPCDVTTALDCSEEIGSVTLRLRGQADPEEVREVRIVMTRRSRLPDAGLVAHTLMAIMEPGEPEEARRQAVLRLLGVGGPQETRVMVGRTEVRFEDGFSASAFVFRPVR